MVSPASPLRHALLIVAAVVLTAVAYFVSSGLQPVWWLVWLAPLPILLVASSVRSRQAFAIALVARALGALNLWTYMRYALQIPLGVVLAAVLVPAVFFGIAVVLFRALLRKGSPWFAALAFPAVAVALEYLLSLWQGTFGNTGYTQLKDLPVLQLASLAGLWGISFTVNLLPAALAAMVYAPVKMRIRMALVFAVYYACVLLYGAMRLGTEPQAAHSVVVGLVETHAGQNFFPPDAQSTMALMHEYAAQVQPLADKGAQFVVFPEMTALIPDATSAKVDALFQETARNAHTQVLLGVLHVTDHVAYNEGRLYSATGEIETVYRKHHLVPVLEGRTTPGSEISVLPQAEGNIGVQICRDMDYPELARRYARRDAGLVLVPAWDQGVDAVWHGHMSLMRGVEDGFTLVRDAKNGLLSASDDRGHILAEQSSRSDGAITSMLTTVPVRHDPTLYQQWGDWFAWVDLAGVAVLIVLAFSRKRADSSATPV
jgi:apolipoprotein N-acyltransferase